jgi:hypothetical protein
MSDQSEQPTEQIEQKTEVQSQSQQPTYEIDQATLEKVFSTVVSNFGGRKFVCNSEVPEKRLLQIVENLKKDPMSVTGCKIYESSLNSDKTVDTTKRTVVFSSFINLKFLGFPKKEAKKVVLSHHMRKMLNTTFEKISVQLDGSLSKVMVFKKLDDIKIPEFVEKNKQDFVFVKVVMKLPVE